MTKTKRSRKLDPDRVAIILVEALYNDDAKTAERWGITTRTLQNYRRRLSNDVELSQKFVLKKKLFESDWAAEVPSTIREAMEFIRRAAKEADHKDAEVIHAIAGAMKVTAEMGLTKEIIDARLGQFRPDRSDREEDRPVDTVESGIIIDQK